MQKYPVRATERAQLAPDRLLEIARAHFESAERDGDRVKTRYGAISSLAAWAEGKSLGIDLVMDPKVPEDVARETIRRYNAFLEAATGYSAKERARRMRKSAGE